MLGLSYDALSARNPRIIVCDISGYGADGPYRDKKAYDLLIQSEAGLVSITGTDDVDVLLAFYDYPAEHWIHLRTTNPIESTFATVRHRTKLTKGPGSRAAGLAMAFKLIEAAQDRWRAVNGPYLVALVRAAATFEGGKLVERPDDHHQPEAVQEIFIHRY